MIDGDPYTIFSNIASGCFAHAEGLGTNKDL